jgi:hypothetical protein
MDWIEKLFGVNPDGGDGSAETMLVLTGVLILATVLAARAPVIVERIRMLFGHRVRR